MNIHNGQFCTHQGFLYVKMAEAFTYSVRPFEYCPHTTGTLSTANPDLSIILHAVPFVTPIRTIIRLSYSILDLFLLNFNDTVGP